MIFFTLIRGVSHNAFFSSLSKYQRREQQSFLSRLVVFIRFILWNNENDDISNAIMLFNIQFYSLYSYTIKSEVSNINNSQFE